MESPLVKCRSLNGRDQFTCFGSRHRSRFERIGPDPGHLPWTAWAWERRGRCRPGRALRTPYLREGSGRAVAPRMRSVDWAPPCKGSAPLEIGDTPPGGALPVLTPTTLRLIATARRPEALPEQRRCLHGVADRRAGAIADSTWPWTFLWERLQRTRRRYLLATLHQAVSVVSGRLSLRGIVHDSILGAGTLFASVKSWRHRVITFGRAISYQ